MTNREAMKFYTDALRPQSRLLVIGMVLICFEAAMLTPIPKVVGLLVDRVSHQDFDWIERNLVWILLGLAGYLSVFMPLAYTRQVSMGRVSLRVFFTLRVRLWRHLQGLSADFFARTHTGDLTSRIVADISTVSTTVVGVIQRILWDLFTLVPAVCMMLYTCWQLTLIVLVYATVQVSLMRRAMPKMRKQSKAIANKLGEISTEATEKLEGMNLIRALAKEEDVAARFEMLNRHHLRLSDHFLRYSTRARILINAPGDLFLNVMLAVLGMLLARRGIISAGGIVAVILYAPMISNPLSRLADAMAQWAAAMGAISRINEIFQAFPSVVEKDDAVNMAHGPGRVSFRDVHFTYPSLVPDGETRKTIDGFTLEIEPGSVVALVGHSGSGKSTIAQLLLRFYDVEEGAIIIDGHDIRDVTLGSLRNNVGIVMQQSIIFAGTILENLRFVKPDATEEEAWDALRFAALEDYVRSLPEGIDTYLGESGVNLSGGQQQRLSIARVFLRDPSVLILDEATSALDTMSERLIQDELEKLMQGRTTIVIAHRLSTIYNADKIVVMQAGRIVEAGTHQELMAHGEAYFELAAAQSQLMMEARD